MARHWACQVSLFGVCWFLLSFPSWEPTKGRRDSSADLVPWVASCRGINLACKVECKQREKAAQILLATALSFSCPFPHPSNLCTCESWACALRSCQVKFIVCDHDWHGPTMTSDALDPYPIQVSGSFLPSALYFFFLAAFFSSGSATACCGADDKTL